MSGLQEIRGRLDAVGGLDQWYDVDEVREALEFAGADASVIADDADLIAHAAPDLTRLLAAVEAVSALHKPRTEQVITGDCADEACEHEEADDCPKTPFEVCSECWRVAEEADAYFSEGGVSIVAYPCPTVEALAAALEAS